MRLILSTYTTITEVSSPSSAERKTSARRSTTNWSRTGRTRSSPSKSGI
nr:MAG TPA: hypothetical protein [Caudoviricetes sp.]